MLSAIETWQNELSNAIRDRLGVVWPPARIPFTFPPRTEMGDAASPVAFALAKELRRNPAEIAQALVPVKLTGVRQVRSVGGYLNLFLDRKEAVVRLLSGGFLPAAAPGKVIVEHTNINPNKAAHVGHLRNAVLGDTLVRCLRYLGRRVEVQNYIDDTGVQVADVVVGFQRLLGWELRDVRNLIALMGHFSKVHGSFARLQELIDAWHRFWTRENLDRFGLGGRIPEKDAEPPYPPVHSFFLHALGRFDAFCWGLYAAVAPWYARCEEHKAARHETLHRMEEGGNETAEMAALVAEEMVRCHLRTMDWLGIRYEVLPHESDILKTGFWAACFEKLKAAGAIHRVPPQAEDKNRGCWVMALKESEEFKGLSDADKVIVRSNGTVTYIGKDMAYQLWKFGLLGQDFFYRRFPAAPYELYRTDAGASEEGAPSFGGGSVVYNVIDVRQAYLQKIVQEGLRQMGYPEQAERSIHFAYEMVALSTSFVRAEMERGARFDVSEEDLAKPFLEMSGRKGLGFQADLLMDRLKDRALEEIAAREPGLPETSPKEWSRRAHALAVGALRYYMVKYGRNVVIPFDLDQALAFEGDTGPYLQYACVRAENILRKAAEQGLEVPAPEDPEEAHRNAPYLDEEGWGLLTLFLRVPLQVRTAVEGLDLNLVARQFFDAAQAFHAYYHHYPVLKEADAEKQRARLYTVALFARLLREGLWTLLGIPVPDRM